MVLLAPLAAEATFWFQAVEMCSSQPSISECFQFLCWYQQRFSSITEGIETPSKNINPMTSFNNCLAKERLLKVIKVPVTLPVATVVTLKPIVYYSFLRMRTWRCQSSAAFSLLFYSTQQNRFCELCKCFPGTSTMCSEVWCEGTWRKAALSWLFRARNLR